MLDVRLPEAIRKRTPSSLDHSMAWCRCSYAAAHRAAKTSERRAMQPGDRRPATARYESPSVADTTTDASRRPLLVRGGRALSVEGRVSEVL